MVVSTFFLLLSLFPRIESAQAEDASLAQQGGDAGLAQNLTNPLADLMTIPIQMNYDQNIGLQAGVGYWLASPDADAEE